MTTKKVIHKHTAKGKGRAKEKPTPTTDAKEKEKAKSTIKKTRTVTRPEKQSDSRCTPMKFRSIYDKLSPQKKRLVDEMGVGEFLITSEKVGHSFGLNYKGELFEKKIKKFEDKLNDEENEALELFRGKSSTFV
ncbi:hypothetical protein PIB30_028989 [Stylosanthes scabra]|uniref:Uncharacterized protein n=1 Tax=Stylosanthes scabra TaxID=79078 RepID=A0ABU6WAW6_9FABA|nr:hypothetical protein [Stylosanthes scabra]